MFLNFYRGTSVTLNTYRATGAIACGNLEEFIESAKSGVTATLSAENINDDFQELINQVKNEHLSAQLSAHIDAALES